MFRFLSTGLAKDTDGDGEATDTPIERIMAIWDRFFANAILNAERNDRKRANARYPTPQATKPRRVHKPSTTVAVRRSHQPQPHASTFERGVAERFHSYYDQGDGGGNGNDNSYGNGYGHDNGYGNGYGDTYGAHGTQGHASWHTDDGAGAGAGSHHTSGQRRHPNQTWGGAQEATADLGRAAWGFALDVSSSNGASAGAAMWATPSPGLPRAVNSSQPQEQWRVEELVMEDVGGPWTPDDPDVVAAAAHDVWEEVMDDDAGIPYYYNHRTGASVWERPITGNYAPSTPAEATEAVQSLAAQRAQSRVAGGRRDAGAGVAPTVNTPPGDAWEQHYTDEGRPYFYNRFLGESSWERPLQLGGGRTASAMFGAAGHDDGSDRASSEHASQYSGGRSGAGSGSGRGGDYRQAPSADRAGRAGAAAAASSSSTWAHGGKEADSPNGYDSYGASTSGAGAGAANDGFWSSEVDDQGRPYEYNLVTGESRWPAAAAPAAAAAAETTPGAAAYSRHAEAAAYDTGTYGGAYDSNDTYAATGNEPGNGPGSGWADHSYRATSTAAAAAYDLGEALVASAAETDGLYDTEWEECFTDDGVRYWYHTATGESVWD